MSKYCGECGAKLERLGNFCTQCGKAIKQIEHVVPKKTKAKSAETPHLEITSYAEKPVVSNRPQNGLGFFTYKESGKVNIISLIILVALGLVATVYLAYGYTFLIDMFTDALASTGKTGGRGGLIVLGLILLVPIIGLVIIYLSISYISVSRNKKLNIIVFIGLAIICWYYSYAYALSYQFNLYLGLDSFPSFTFFPGVDMTYVLQYIFTEDTFLTIFHLLELAIFVAIAVFAAISNSYYCEPCKKRMDSSNFYVISTLEPNDYLNQMLKKSAIFLQQPALSKEELLAHENIENKYFYHCELSQCATCEEKIIDLKRVEIENKEDKRKVEDKEKVATGIYLLV